MAAPLLRPLASLVTLATQPISPSFYPYALATTIHAARITLAYRGRTQALGFKGKKSRAVDWMGYLIMCWGGSFLVSFLLGAPPPQLLSIHPFLNYISVYLVLSNLPAPSPATLDTLLPFIDGLTRSFPITGAVLAASSHSNPAIANSLLFQIILGGLASSGGGLVASTLNVFSPNWSIQTPPILNADFFGSMDFWAGASSAAIFGLLTKSHSSYGKVLAYINDGSETPIMTVLGGRSVVVLVLGVFYGIKAIKMHWMGVPVVKRVEKSKAVGNSTSLEEKSATAGLNRSKAA